MGENSSGYVTPRTYIINLSTETVSLPDWRLAMEALSLPTTLARLAFLTALNSNAQG